ncbi:PD-(D/E)XK nuclease family protein [Solwaraspora sp. WMMB335]|uniref:PD-(D/E)XK nuclease family protein n=1 Tax=Solwaraspora sp. WMMB335 TaxID=3404118 RepID=UPI003B947D7B
MLLGTLMNAIKQVERHLAAGIARDEAVQLGRLAFTAWQDGARRFLDHALNLYYQYHEARVEQLGQLRFLGPTSSLRKADTATLTVWGPVYEAPGDVIEIRRFRLGSAQTPTTAWAYIAAHIAAHTGTENSVQRIWVSEIGLIDGIEHHVLPGITPEHADELYELHGRSAAKAAAMGTEAVPGHGCAQCRIGGACGKLMSLPGFLAAKQRRDWTGSLSASDLEVYDRCPSQWYMERDLHLPSSQEHSEYRVRGVSVHRWLAAAHRRGHRCSPSDLPVPGSDTAPFGTDVLDPDEYRLAYPYLLQHLGGCPLQAGRIDEFMPEQTLYGFDPAADLVIATKVDAAWRVGDSFVLREVKTVHALPLGDKDELFTRYLAVAWGLRALEAGMAKRFGAVRGEVELELLSPEGSVVHHYSTDDLPLMKMARGRIRRLGHRWLADNDWSPQPNPGCSSCGVRRWCASADEWANRTPAAVTAGSSFL